MRIFLDANILVSVLNKEYPLFTYSARIVSLADHKRFTVFTSPLCLAIAFYFAEKKSGTKLAKQKISILAHKLSVAPVTGAEVFASLQNKRVHDFEDGLQYYSAMNSKCEVIITEDVKDYYYAETEVLNAKRFIEKYLF